MSKLAYSWTYDEGDQCLLAERPNGEIPSLRDLITVYEPQTKEDMRREMADAFQKDWFAD
jgi:hypothetical protein